MSIRNKIYQDLTYIRYVLMYIKVCLGDNLSRYDVVQCAPPHLDTSGPRSSEQTHSQQHVSGPANSTTTAQQHSASGVDIPVADQTEIKMDVAIP